MLCLLGLPAIATTDGIKPLELRPKALALLARVALEDGSVDRLVLADFLFHRATDPRGSLRWHLSYLRARIPDALIVDRLAVRARVSTDVTAFRAGARRILEDPGTPDAVETLALYRGDVCTGLQVSASADFDNWLYVQQDELRRTFRRAATAHARAALLGGHSADAIPSLRRLTEIDPYLEEGHVLLVRATEAAGRENEARHAYDRYQRIMRTELHAEPRPDLSRTFESRRDVGRGLPLDELIPLEEITMHVVDWPGEDPPILAIHGSAGHAYGLTALGERLAPERRFLAVDLRGHGFSDKPPTSYGVEEHVADVLQLIEALGLERPILLGHSIGGAIATLVAEASDDRVGGLVLFDAVVGDRRFVEDASFVVDEFGAGLDQRFATFDEYHGRWIAEPEDSPWRRWLERSDRMELAPLPNGMLRRRALREALAAEWASVARADMLTTLSRVQAPVLVVYADGPWDDGPYLDQATVEAQIAATHDSRLYVASGLHHGDIIRRPSDGLLRALKEFAKDVRTKTHAAGEASHHP